MKYILLILSLTIQLLSNDNYELKLYQTLLPTIFQKDTLTIYVKDIEQLNIIKGSTILKVSNNCANVDLIIGKNFDNLPQECKAKPIFSTSYRSFINSENSFGAFYWSKGRPQVQFKLKIIEKYSLYLPNNLMKYAK